MRILRNTLAAIIACLIIIGCVPVVSAETKTEGDFNYSITDDAVTVVKYTGSDADVTIPDKIEGLDVTKLGEAFLNNKTLTSVKMPDTLIEIANYAFRGCDKLTTVKFGKNVEKLGVWVFEGNKSLESVTLPEKLKIINQGDFRSCTSLTEVNIPEGVTEIGWGAFTGCSALTEIKLPETLKNIEQLAFSDCSKLKTVNLGENITSIGYLAFENDVSLESITLPEGLTSLSGTFGNCSALKQVNIPESVTVVGNGTFSGCSALREIEIPEGVTEFGDAVFSDCTSLEKLDLPKKLQKIGACAFQHCALIKELVIPETVTEIGSAAFKSCASLEKVNIPESVTEISYELFLDCSALKSLGLPKGITKIGASAFKNTGLEEISLPDTLTLINTEAFSGCKSLKKLTVPDKVEALPIEAFAACASLEQVTISEGVKKLNNRCFKGCTSLKSVELPSSVTDLGENCFEGCSSLEEISVPESVKVFNKYLFKQCRSLVSVNIPEGVTAIYEGAFYGCKSLKIVSLPETVTFCGSKCFLGCISLEEIRLSSRLSCINGNMFNSCHSLKSIRIPASANKIYASSFYECFSLRDVYILNPSITIDNNCCLGIGSSVQEISPHFMISGYGGSTAETYAKEKNLRFTDLSIDTSQYNTVINVVSENLKVKQYFTRKIDFTVDEPCGCTRFQSSDEEIATVDADGNVKGMSIGTAYIAITNGRATAVVKVDVTAAEIDIEHEHSSTNYKYYFAEDKNEQIYVRITKYKGTMTDVKIPSKIKGYPVKEIGEEAFAGEHYIDENGKEYDGGLNVESIVIPEGVEKLGRAAFIQCNKLKSVKFPSTIKYVGEMLFYSKYSSGSNRNIDTVEFPSTKAFIDYVSTAYVTSYQPYMHTNSLDDVFNRYALPNQCPYNLVINGKVLKHITIPEGMTELKNNFFYNCKSIESVTLPDGMETIGRYAFCNCLSLKSVSVPPSVSVISSYAFQGCSKLSEITLPEYLKELGWYALADSGIKKITFPENTLVYSCACSGCKQLENIFFYCKKLPGDHRNIFQNCSSVKSIYTSYNSASINSDFFDGITSSPTCYGTGDLYHVAKKNGWEFVETPFPWEAQGSDSSNLNPIPVCPDYLYDADTDTYTVTDREGANSGEEAYPSTEAWNAKTVVFDYDAEVCLTQWCTQWFYGVENVIVKGNILDIDNQAFMFNKGTLKSAELSDNVRMISNGAFTLCENLTTVKGGKGLRTIGYNSFNGSKSLEDIDFADSAEFIGYAAFRDCTGLSDIKISDTVKTVGSFAFLNCTGVDEVEIPSSVTEIGEYAFGYLYNKEQGDYYPIEGFTVVAEKNSAAEKYALDNGFKIRYLGEAPTTTTPKLSASKLTVTAGKVKNLKAYNCAVKNWTSSSPKVVTVKNGKITALKKGAATITAALTTGDKLICKVTVTTSPKLSRKSVTVRKGKAVTVRITGKAAAVNNVYYNTKYAKVISKTNATTIKLKGLRTGTTTLKLKVNGVVLKLKVKVK